MSVGYDSLTNITTASQSVCVGESALKQLLQEIEISVLALALVMQLLQELKTQ